MTTETVSEKGCKTETIRDVRRRRSEENRRLRRAMNQSPQPENPTPEEIAAGCLAIQAEWSEEEREKRIVGGMRAKAWQVPGGRYERFRDDDE